MKSYTRWFAILVATLFIGSLTFAQDTAAPAPKAQEVTIRIEQATPPPPVNQTAAKTANEWVEMGTNMGAAMGGAAKAILKETKDATFGEGVSVVDGIDKFSKTDAGRFTMVVVAWKVMGRDAIDLLDRVKNVAIGVPFLIAWTIVFIWFWRKQFTIHSIVRTKTGQWWNAVYTYEKVNDDGEWSDAKNFAAFGTAAVYAIATIAIAVNIIF